MKPTGTGHEAIGHDDLLVHDWRVSQLTRLGIPGPLAEVHADHVDWHQMARLVHRGFLSNYQLIILCSNSVRTSTDLAMSPIVVGLTMTRCSTRHRWDISAKPRSPW